LELSISLNTEIENIKSLFEQTPEMFCILSGPTHVFEYVNEAHIKALGFNATGMQVREAQPESVEVHGILDDVYNTGVTASLREIPVTLGKEVRFFDLTYAAKRDSDCKINGIMILGAEVTGKVLADKKVELERRRMFNFFEQIPAAIAVLNGPDFIFELANSSYKKLLGSTRQLIGVPIVKAIPEIGPEIPDMLKNVRETGERFIAYDYPLSIDWSNTGTIELKYITFCYEPLTSATGEIEGVLVFVYDVTDHNIAKEKIKNALTVRDEFLSIASHELKTPLTSLNLQIQSAQRRLAKGFHEEFSVGKLNDFFEKYKKQNDRLVRLVDDMLDLSKINLGKLSFNLQNLNLVEIVKNSYDNIKEQFEAKNGQLIFHCPSQEVLGNFDSGRIEQVITNLLTNALKYGEGRPVQIDLLVTKGIAKIRVKDEGPGILVENFERIFQKFERVPSNLDVSGLGLGLFISKEIIEAHGGKISVENNSKRGAIFIVELPIV
jgi:signal transduction histidine kinase